MESHIPSFNTLRRWGIKGGLSILDQAVFSAANFFVSVFLARSLSIQDFGAFAFGFAVVIFCVQVYTSFALEPMSVLGPSRYQERLISYLLGHVWLLFILSVPTGILLGLVIWLDYLISNHFASASILIFCVVNLPFILFPLLMRRIFYVLSKPAFALLGSVIYFFVLVFSLYATLQLGDLNGISGMFILSISGLLSGLVLFLLLQKNSSTLNSIDLKVIMSETWTFSKWLIISGILLGWVTQSQTYLTGLLSSVESAGAVRILQMFIQPMMLTATAFSSLATPAISADFKFKAYKPMQRKMIQFTLALGGITIVYEILLIFFGAPLNQILFQGKYSLYTNQIPIWGLLPIILAFFWGAVISLQASQKPQAMLIISISWAGASFALGLLTIPSWGVVGATISALAGFIAAFVSTWILYWTWVHQVYVFESK